MKKLALGLALGILIGMALVIIAAVVSRPAVQRYTGEGDISVIGSPILTPGYVVEFTAFDMEAPFQQQFRVSDLPRGRGWPLFAVLVVTAGHDPFGEYSGEKPSGSLALRLSDAEGDVVFDVRAPVSDWIKAESNSLRGGFQEFELYWLSDDASTSVDPSRISPDSELTLEIDYESGESPVHGLGEPRIRVGGYL